MTTVWTLATAMILAAAILVFQIIKNTRQDKEAGQVLYENDCDYIVRRREMLSSCKNRYMEAAKSMSIPDNAPVAVKCSCIFGLEYVQLDHYIWRRGNMLYYFPTWDSIALHILDPEYIPVFAWRGKAHPSNWAIPAEFLEYYAVDEYHGFTAVYYNDGMGIRYRTVFLNGADIIFARLFPGRAYSTVQRRAYLSSTDNIIEINDRISQLKVKKDQGLISHDEYETQRDYLMRSM